MALINCKECGKEIADTSQACVHCGCILEGKETKFEKIKKIVKNKKIMITVSVIIVVVLGVMCISLCSSEPMEREASKYINEVKKMNNVEEINAVICISKEYYGRDENTLGYVVLYSTKTDSDFAYFEEGVYKGNGYNGGNAETSEDESFNNLHSLYAIKEAVEFIDGANLAETTCERYYEREEGVVYINLIDFKSWIVKAVYNFS